MNDDKDNATVASASSCKKVLATVGGCYSVRAAADSGGILHLFLFPPLHL